MRNHKPKVVPDFSDYVPLIQPAEPDHSFRIGIGYQTGYPEFPQNFFRVSGSDVVTFGAQGSRFFSIGGLKIQKHTGFQYKKGKQDPSAIIPFRFRVYVRNPPGDHRRKEGREEQRMAEASLVYKVIYRAAKGDKDIQIRQGS